MKLVLHKSLIIGFCIALAIETYANESIEAVRVTAKEWVAVEKAISSEAVAWEAKQALLHDLIEVTEAEIEMLNKSISEIAAARSSADAVRQKLLAEQTMLEANFSTLRAFLITIEPQLRTLRKRLPKPLLETLAPYYQKLPADSENTSISVAERMQNLSGILTAIQQFDRKITVDNEIRTLADGIQAEVQVVYIGLGIGYYRTQSGEDAGIIYPGNDGWIWKSEPELNKKIDDAIMIARQDRAIARFVDLPVNVKP